jgi:hypothetical protein
VRRNGTLPAGLPCHLSRNEWRLRACNATLVLDRGYPSHELLQTLVQEGIDFLVRVPATHTFDVIDELRESGGDDYLFYVDPPPGSPPEWTRLKLRAVRIEAPDGSESFFLTTLRRSQFRRTQLRELYHLRWEVEEFYKLLKGPYIGQGQFRSKSPNGVRQEIHALVLFLAIARILMATAAKATGVDYDSVSQKSAILGLATYFTRLFLTRDSDVALRELRALVQRVLSTPYKRRSARSFPRVSYRPRPRWGPRVVPEGVCEANAIAGPGGRTPLPPKAIGWNLDPPGPR